MAAKYRHSKSYQTFVLPILQSICVIFPNNSDNNMNFHVPLLILSPECFHGSGSSAATENVIGSTQARPSLANMSSVELFPAYV